MRVRGSAREPCRRINLPFRYTAVCNCRAAATLRAARADLRIPSGRINRRNDSAAQQYDITQTISTTDPAAVCAEVVRIEQALYDGAGGEVEHAFALAGAMYRGEHFDYSPCDTEYQTCSMCSMSLWRWRACLTVTSAAAKAASRHCRAKSSFWALSALC